MKVALATLIALATFVGGYVAGQQTQPVVLVKEPDPGPWSNALQPVAHPEVYFTPTPVHCAEDQVYSGGECRQLGP